jgi:hypothetical protein
MEAIAPGRLWRPGADSGWAKFGVSALTELQAEVAALPVGWRCETIFRKSGWLFHHEPLSRRGTRHI